MVAGQQHIKKTHLKLQQGHFNVLLGKTGSGKTSLIKLIAGLDAISSGTIRMNGEDITKISTQLREVSLVHQFFINYPHMSVFDNIASPLKISGMAYDEIRERVVEVADILKLTSMLKRRPHELSGGQQQRTALARAIVKKSKIVLLDEPLANLDYKLREELRELLPDLFADRGAIVIYATSEPREALLLGGKTALMEDGYVREFGNTLDIYRYPKSLVSAQIFSDPPINCAEVNKQGNNIVIGQSSWILPKQFHTLKDEIYHMAIHPHHILPYKTEKNTQPLKGWVGVSELSGSESNAHFTFEGNNWISLAHGTHTYANGKAHTFYINLEECLFFSSNGQRVS